MNNEGRLKQILYILGSGRSGSTLLDIMLGNAESVFSCGELRRFALHGGISSPKEQSAESIQFWTKISNELEKKLPELDSINWKEQCHGIEYHTRFLAPWRLTQDKMAIYGRYVNALMDLIFEETGASWLVDSSKYPGRLLALLKVSKYPVSVIYLTRHPVGVVDSFKRKDVEQPGKGFLAANSYYTVNGFLCRAVFHCVPSERRLKVRYEDIVRVPEQTLSAIEKKLSVNLKIPISIAAGGKPYRVGHLVDGNRVRLKREILLQSSEQQYGWSIGEVFTRIFNRIWY